MRSGRVVGKPVRPLCATVAGSYGSGDCLQPPSVGRHRPDRDDHARRTASRSRPRRTARGRWRERIVDSPPAGDCRSVETTVGESDAGAAVRGPEQLELLRECTDMVRCETARLRHGSRCVSGATTRTRSRTSSTGSSSACSPTTWACCPATCSRACWSRPDARGVRGAAQHARARHGRPDGRNRGGRRGKAAPVPRPDRPPARTYCRRRLRLMTDQDRDRVVGRLVREHSRLSADLALHRKHFAGSVDEVRKLVDHRAEAVEVRDGKLTVAKRAPRYEGTHVIDWPSEQQMVESVAKIASLESQIEKVAADLAAMGITTV